MQYADRLFGVFQRRHEARHSEDTVVGLSIVQQIVPRHGGADRGGKRDRPAGDFRFTLPRESTRA